MKNKIFSLLLLSCLSFSFAATATPLTPEQQQIKQQGINYYMIQHCELAEPLLKQVAEAGDNIANITTPTAATKTHKCSQMNPPTGINKPPNKAISTP